MTITHRFITCIAAMLTIFTATNLSAGEITGVSWFSGVASVAGTFFSPPSSPNNDDVIGTSPNSIFVTQKDYFGIGPVDLVFNVIDTGGVTEYLVIEGVQNNTGVDWGGYHIELGFGIDAGFVASAPGDGLDFDAPDFNSDFFFNPSPGFFPTATVTEDDILAGGGVMPYLSFAGNFIFHVDVPDGITSFTIRQSPVAVPEPSTLALSFFGLLGLSMYARRRRPVMTIEKRFTSALCVVLIATGVVGGSGLASLAHADTLTTSQPVAPSDRDPAWGQGITLNVGADLPDASIPAIVMLDFVGLRTGLPSAGSPDDRTAVYMHVYDAFGINGDGTVDGGAIGSLLGVSTNTVDLETPADSTDVIWFFAGTALAKDAIHHYILATDTVAATSGDFNNLIYSDFVVAYGNPHAGGQHYRQTGDLGDGPASGDLYFRVQSSFSPVPEPSTFVLGGITLLVFGLYGWRRKP